jgi:hypothetical protein
MPTSPLKTWLYGIGARDVDHIGRLFLPERLIGEPEYAMGLPEQASPLIRRADRRRC